MVILLLGVLILGYGFNNALKAKNYGKDVSDLVADTLNTFSEIKGSAPLAKTRAVFEKISEKAKTSSDRIEAMQTPKGTETLRSDAIQADEPYVRCFLQRRIGL